MFLISDCIEQARDILQDARIPYRHETEELMRYFNNALAETYRLRPDLFIGQNFTLTKYGIADTGLDFPISEALIPQFAVYIAGFAELSDDEFSTDGRAITLMNKFAANLVTTA